MTRETRKFDAVASRGAAFAEGAHGGWIARETMEYEDAEGAAVMRKGLAARHNVCVHKSPDYWRCYLDFEARARGTERMNVAATRPIAATHAPMMNDV